jgi:VanZ family protein
MYSFLVRVAGWLVIIVIIILSLMPGHARPHSGVDGGYEHLLAYLSAGILLGFGYPERNARIRLGVLLIVLSGVFEILQLWAPGRHSELAGFLGSSAGATLGMIAAAMVTSRRSQPP